MSDPLSGVRLLVPPSRLSLNPLQTMVARVGAEVVSFPRLVATRPDPALLDAAARQVGRYDWVVFAGGAGVEHFFERLEEVGGEPGALRGQVAAIGHGALKALRDHGVEVDYRPREHFAEGVVAGLGPLEGRAVLLVREVSASRRLPDQLTAAGAEVTAVAGHEVSVNVDKGAVREAWSRRLDLVAFANPATVRLFARALKKLELDPQRCLAGVTVTVVGPATARAAEAHGLPADLVAGGRLKPLLTALVDLAGR